MWKGYSRIAPQNDRQLREIIANTYGMISLIDHNVGRILIDNRPGVNVTDKNGWTPLHWAAWKNSFEVAGLLIKHSADVNMKDKDGWTPLDGAAWNKCSDVARVLIQHGASTDGIDLSWMDDRQ